MYRKYITTIVTKQQQESRKKSKYGNIYIDEYLSLRPPI